MAKVKIANSLLLDETALASALLVALKSALGDCWGWEPESIWLELSRKGIDVPEGNRAKILAGITLYFTPSFYWDAGVFGKTALAFAGHPANPDMLEEATTAELAWAVREAARIVSWHGDEPHEFHHEPKAYAAVVMHREGLVLAPKELEFAQEILDGLNCKDVEEGKECPAEPLRDATKKAWAAMNKESLATHAFPEDRAGVQLARLAAIELYLNEHQARV